MGQQGQAHARHLVKIAVRRYAAGMAKSQLSHLAVPGARIAVRVTPKASRNKITQGDDGTVRAYVTVPPADGKANIAVQGLLAKALGVPKARLTLAKGQKARDKIFMVSMD